MIARNTQRGQILEISRGDLIKLVQDERIPAAAALTSNLRLSQAARSIE